MEEHPVARVFDQIQVLETLTLVPGLRAEDGGRAGIFIPLNQ